MAPKQQAKNCLNKVYVLVRVCGGKGTRILKGVSKPGRRMIEKSWDQKPAGSLSFVDILGELRKMNLRREGTWNAIPIRGSYDVGRSRDSRSLKRYLTAKEANTDRPLCVLLGDPAESVMKRCITSLYKCLFRSALGIDY